MIPYQQLFVCVRELSPPFQWQQPGWNIAKQTQLIDVHAFGISIRVLLSHMIARKILTEYLTVQGLSRCDRSQNSIRISKQELGIFLCRLVRGINSNLSNACKMLSFQHNQFRSLFACLFIYLFVLFCFFFVGEIVHCLVIVLCSLISFQHFSFYEL